MEKFNRLCNTKCFYIRHHIKKNIAFASEDNEINEQDFKNSVQQAQINEFLDKLPQGQDSLVGEKGLKLSGGQIQRGGNSQMFI